jgi:hypothetical protein
VVIDAMGLRWRKGDRQVYRMLAVLLRSTRLHRPVSDRQALRVLWTVLKADPSLGMGRSDRFRYAANQIRRDLPKQGANDDC